LANGYFVVDGQQRLTAITILLHSFIKHYFEGQKKGKLLDGKQEVFWQEEYICRPERHGSPSSFIFGYQTDNPSNLFFKAKILEQKGIAVTEETAYTNNLLAAKQYFEAQITEYIKNKGRENLEVLCATLVQKFKFDFKVINKNLDIFMVFETMNARGKLLSNLEKLKNRLIYLSTILHNKTQVVQDTDNNNNQLRTTIVEAWKKIYQELGRDKRLANTDDVLLNYHWIMYDNYDRRRAAAYADDLFGVKFTVEKTIRGDLSVQEATNYVNSLSNTAQWWFVINNPLSDVSRKYLEAWCNKKEELEEIINLLAQIDTLGYRFFVPLIFAALNSASPSQLVDFLRAIEHYLFLIFTISARRANTGSYNFNGRANDLYKQADGWIVSDVADEVNVWIYGGEDYYGYLNLDSFYQQLEANFENKEKKGYQSWSGIKYFLAVYSGKFNEIVQEWSQYKVVTIYNNRANKQAGFDSFDKKKYTAQERRHLKYSLGNLFLIKTSSKAPKVEEWSLQKMKKKSQLDDWTSCSVWTPQAILERGKNMLAFLEEHWNLKNTYRYRRPDDLRLLFLEFMAPIATEEVD
jgi:hypothetical protein